MAERPGEIAGAFFQPVVEMFDIDPLSLTDFNGVEVEGTFGLAGIDPDELVAGLFAGGLFKGAL